MIQIIHILAFINVLLIHGIIVPLWYETFSWLLFALLFWFVRFSSGFYHEGSGKDLQWWCKGPTFSSFSLSIILSVSISPLPVSKRSSELLLQIFLQFKVEEWKFRVFVLFCFVFYIWPMSSNAVKKKKNSLKLIRHFEVLYKPFIFLFDLGSLHIYLYL